MLKSRTPSACGGVLDLDNVFINLILVQEGFAHSYSYPPDIKEQSKFIEAERLAREQKKGLWSACPITAPAITPPPASTSPTPPPSNSCNIKGNISSAGEKIYHIEGCGSYSQTKIDETRGEKWFCNEAEAVFAGWRKAKNCP